MVVSIPIVFCYHIIARPFKAIGALLGFLLLGILSSDLAAEELGGASILFPEAKEPYSTIFKDTINGINTYSGLKVRTRAVTRQSKQKSIDKWLGKKKPAVSVALGHRSLKVLQSSPHVTAAPILTAAFLSLPESLDNVAMTVTYTPDPDLIFRTFSQLSPDTKKIHVVINESRWYWLLDFAQRAAETYGFTLQTHNANNVQESARIYGRVLTTMDPKLDSLWLPQDSSTLDNELIMPLILDVLWARKLKVFSSSLSSVNRGVLLGVYPDNIGMGRYLGELSREMAKGNIPEENLQPLRQIFTALNIRTAKHIDINVEHELMKTFELVLPKNVP